MAAIQDRTAAELKAELSAAIAHSRALLGESVPPPDAGASLSEEPVDRLTGMELSFDETATESSRKDTGDIDIGSLSDEELDAILQETAPAYDKAQALLAQLKHEVARNPLPWAVGALVIAASGTRLLLGDSPSSFAKNPRQNASQSAESAITHGSLLGQMMTIGIEMARPALLEATKGWLTRIVEK
jgi:hypothetical protein